MKIGAFTRYARRGASSRVRFLQYVPALEAQGFVVQHNPLFEDGYIDALQSSQSRRSLIVQSMVRRATDIRAANRLDAIWMEKDALPWLPASLELGLIPKDAPLVLDYDDAVFHQYDMHPNPLVRGLLARKHQALMQRATLVVAGNQYIADYAQRAGASRVELLPTVVDLERYSPAEWPPREGHRVLPTAGWIGQRSTAAFLRPLIPVMERLRHEGLVQFRAIGIDGQALGLPMTSEAWGEDTEVDSIRGLDIGIMPLEDGPFERGKCGYKLIQYMACGLPVVASPVGVNAVIVEHGINGFLAATPAEWEAALRLLAADPALRLRMGQAGRARVEREYGLQVTAPLLAGWLKQAIDSKEGIKSCVA
ncbi:MAG: glycosyltransferase family 4 protein [Burkholderiaceae bacterium]